MKVVDLCSLSGDEQRLIDLAWMARLHAYADYSGFKVGAAVGMRMENGLLIGDGCNVENAAYAGGHAEHGAIHQLAMSIPSGMKLHIDVVAVALVASGKKQHAVPCGICRQWLREVGTDKMVIYGVKLNEYGVLWQVERFTLGELLKYSFGPNNLNR